MESSIGSVFDYQIQELVQSIHRLTGGRPSSELEARLHSEPWKGTTKASCYYLMSRQDQEVVDWKFQRLDEGTKDFVSMVFPNLSKELEESLLTDFRNLHSKDLASVLKKEQSLWQWLFEDPEVWTQLEPVQKQAVLNKFLILPESLRNFAARCIPCMPEIREPFFDALANLYGEEMLVKVEQLMKSTELILWAHLEPKIANMIKAKLSSLVPEEQVFAKGRLLQMSIKDQKVFALDLLNLSTQKLSDGIQAAMKRDKEERISQALQLGANVADKEEMLKCPACLNLPTNVIFSCSNQHIICSGCLPQLVGNTCPTCREDLGVRPRHHIFAEAGVRELRLLREVTGSPTEQRKPRTM